MRQSDGSCPAILDVFADTLICKSMKKNTLEKIEKILLDGGDELEVNDEIAKKALIPLEKMLELAGD